MFLFIFHKTVPTSLHNAECNGKEVGTDIWILNKPKKFIFSKTLTSQLNGPPNTSDLPRTSLNIETNITFHLSSLSIRLPVTLENFC